MMRKKHSRGRESVWDCPRPPSVGVSKKKTRVVFKGFVVAKNGLSETRNINPAFVPLYYPARFKLLELLEASLYY